MAHEAIAAALWAAPVTSTPNDLWRLIRAAVPAGSTRVRPAEAAGLLDEAMMLVHDPLTDGQPPDWQWNLRDDISILRRVAAGDRVHLTDLLGSLRTNLIAHRWHMDHRGKDRLIDARSRYVGLVGRLAVHATPAEWEHELMRRPAGPVTQGTIGQLIRRRRKALGWTQAETARRIGVDRDSIISWEQDRHRPSRGNAVALAEAIGGDQSDYFR